MTVEEAIPLLKSKIKERSLIPFCGAGISIPSPSNLPSAREFIEPYKLSGLKFCVATEILEKNISFRNDFNRTFGRSTIKPNILHKLLAQLNAKYYITTNYDQLLESAFSSQNNKNLAVIRREGDLPKVSTNDNILIKIHGDIEIQDLLVLTKSHYDNRLHNPTLIDSYVQCLFTTNTILFIGYSLSDDDIFSLLNKLNNLIAADISEKYIVLPNESTIDKKYLEFFDVKPIYLNCDNDQKQITSHLASFLYQLWEQMDFFSILTKMIEANKKPELREAVERAVALRRENETGKAKDILNELFKRPTDSWENQISLLPTILWLFVSIYDKLEKWKDIETVENARVLALLNTLQVSLPSHIYNAICFSYHGNVAMAMLRAMNLEEAKNRLNLSSNYQLTYTSPESMIIYKANLYVIEAIAKYIEFIFSNSQNETLLKEAIKKIDLAKGLFDKCSDDCHHKGRFNGIYALIETQKKNPDLEIIFEKADLAHNGSTNGENRTKYGKVAGKYCEAYCHYWAVSVETDLDKKVEHLNQARELLISVEDDIKPNQHIAKIKIYGLLRKVINELNDGDFHDYEQKYITAIDSLNPEYRKKIESYGIDSDWLKIPLN